MYGGRDARQIAHGAGPVRHVRQAHQRDVVVERADDRVGVHAGIDVGMDQPDRAEAGQDVPVGGEVVVVGDDHPAPRPGRQGRAGQLVQVDAGRVGQDHLARPGADEAGQHVTGLPAQLDPPGPAVDQVRAPLHVDRHPQPFPGRHRQPAQRVAVQVHGVRVGDDEPVPVPGERVGGVQLLGPGERGVGHGSNGSHPLRRDGQGSATVYPSYGSSDAWGR